MNQPYHDDLAVRQAFRVAFDEMFDEASLTDDPIHLGIVDISPNHHQGWGYGWWSVAAVSVLLVGGLFVRFHRTSSGEQMVGVPLNDEIAGAEPAFDNTAPTDLPAVTSKMVVELTGPGWSVSDLNEAIDGSVMTTYSKHDEGERLSVMVKTGPTERSLLPTSFRVRDEAVRVDGRVATLHAGDGGLYLVTSEAFPDVEVFWESELPESAAVVLGSIRVRPADSSIPSASTPSSTIPTDR